jgi:hypothetical protein
VATGDLNDIKTIFVTGSRTVARADGRVAIVLQTQQGSTAFEVDLQAIGFLRQNLDQAETILRQKPARA